MDDLDDDGELKVAYCVYFNVNIQLSTDEYFFFWEPLYFFNNWIPASYKKAQQLRKNRRDVILVSYHKWLK